MWMSMYFSFHVLSKWGIYLFLIITLIQDYLIQEYFCKEPLAINNNNSNKNAYIRVMLMEKNSIIKLNLLWKQSTNSVFLKLRKLIPEEKIRVT